MTLVELESGSQSVSAGHAGQAHQGCGQLEAGGRQGADNLISRYSFKNILQQACVFSAVKPLETDVVQGGWRCKKEKRKLAEHNSHLCFDQSVIKGKKLWLPF